MTAVRFCGWEIKGSVRVSQRFGGTLRATTLTAYDRRGLYCHRNPACIPACVSAATAFSPAASAPHNDFRVSGLATPALNPSPWGPSSPDILH
ncbi:hypothetical protein NDU88_007709 [Pleurodeles waltl]|uniref:Uncharacterized protein n=1 Tax=Pleurodeles waltl TaxID=8319 RepID=A0AAV7VQH1_PLEWA|nr:hypothetical protein NDU88_007709 [Pleurodeles waltl]